MQWQGQAGTSDGNCGTLSLFLLMKVGPDPALSVAAVLLNPRVTPMLKLLPISQGLNQASSVGLNAHAKPQHSAQNSSRSDAEMTFHLCVGDGRERCLHRGWLSQSRGLRDAAESIARSVF